LLYTNSDGFSCSKNPLPFGGGSLTLYLSVYTILGYFHDIIEP